MPWGCIPPSAPRYWPAVVVSLWLSSRCAQRGSRLCGGGAFRVDRCSSSTATNAPRSPETMALLTITVGLLAARCKLPTMASEPLFRMAHPAQVIRQKHGRSVHDTPWYRWFHPMSRSSSTTKAHEVVAEMPWTLPRSTSTGESSAGLEIRPMAVAYALHPCEGYHVHEFTSTTKLPSCYLVASRNVLPRVTGRTGYPGAILLHKTGCHRRHQLQRLVSIKDRTRQERREPWYALSPHRAFPLSLLSFVVGVMHRTAYML
ncbi:hypothetical protein QBC39DRAFT_40905 [Podospora conica]|nr:hypothetical protein QBC39DRAFT_40905 [Schizothecium conicum]